MAIPLLLAGAPVPASPLTDTIYAPQSLAQTSLARITRPLSFADYPAPAADAMVASDAGSLPVPSLLAEKPAATPAPQLNDPNTIVVSAQKRATPGDPLESLNAASYEAVQAVDEAIVAPITHGYMKAVPGQARAGIHNFINNLDEPIVFLNFLLQLKPGKAFETLGRFVINSTLGVLGLVDVAKRKPFNLPRRSNGLADTLGYYGVKTGPYLFLPLIGPTTLRDLFGRVIDLSILPLAGKPFNKPAFVLAKGTLSSLDDRAQQDETLKRIREESGDPYLATREYYLKTREAEIDVLRGKRKSIYDPPIDPVPAPQPETEPEPDAESGSLSAPAPDPAQ